MMLRWKREFQCQWDSPIGLWKEKERLRKKMLGESEDYRQEAVVLRTLAVYWMGVIASLISITFVLDWVF